MPVRRRPPQLSDPKKLRKKLKEHGLRIVTGNGKHDKIVNEHGKFIGPWPGSPGDHRSLKNLISDLRKKGYDLR